MMRQSLSGHFSATVLPTSCLLLAAIFRCIGLARDQRLHPDEALYGYLARRVGLWGDWQLLEFPVDKPPLFFFTNGLFQRLIGESEFATRLPNAFASLLLIAIVYRLALDLTQDRPTASISALILALSPLDIAFAISGFTDTQMVLWFMASLLLLHRKRLGWAGLCYGLSIAVKPATLWLLPVLVWQMVLTRKIDLKAVLRFLGGFLVVILLISLWDRAGSLGSFWRLGQTNYAGGRLIRSDEVLPRLREWLHLVNDAAPHHFLIWGGIIAWMFHNLWNWRQMPRKALFTWGWSIFIVGYLSIHWLSAFNLFERYLLPILPLGAIVLAVGWRRFGFLGVVLVLGICLVAAPNLMRVSTGQSELASDGGQHTGVDDLAQVMNTRYAGEIFYEHWLGWELNYYLGSNPEVLLLYFPTPQALYEFSQTDLMQIDVPRYFVAPRQPQTDFWIQAMREYGLSAEVSYRDDAFIIYALRAAS